MELKRTPKRGLSVSYNEAEIRKYRKLYAGFFCILTNVKIDYGELLEIYRRKDIVENCFDDLKNGLDMKRLRVHSSAAMDTRLFIQFLASILLSKIRVVIKGCKELQYKSPREIMETMESIVRITYSGRYGSIISETGPLQEKIIEVFGVNLKT
jgi:transposase